MEPAKADQRRSMVSISEKGVKLMASVAPSSEAIYAEITRRFGARKLVVGLGLNGSGPTEVYVGYPGTYPNGFVASSSSGARLVYDGLRVVRASRMSWDAKRRRVVLPGQRRSVTFTLQPR